MAADRRLVIIIGQEGAGKSTVVRELVRHTPCGAQIDAEDVGQVNPWRWNQAFKELLWKNVASLARNFWEAGYANVIAGSFINDYADYLGFRSHLDGDMDVYLIQLCASNEVRDRRRITRPKPTSKEWRDRLDSAYPEDTALGSADADYQYIRIDSSGLTPTDTVNLIRQAIPEIYGVQQ